MTEAPRMAALWVTPEQAAEQLGVPLADFKKGMRRGVVPYTKLSARTLRVPLSWSSEGRMTPAHRWGIEFRRCLVTRGVTVTEAAARVGINVSGVYALRAGDKMPTLATSAALAEEFDWPRLATLAVELRTGSCAVCGAPFVDAGKNAIRRYCSTRCQRTDHARKTRATTDESLVGGLRISKNRLTDYQQAVNAMCHDCTLGEGVCVQPECHLRLVSPIPLIQLTRRRAA